MTTNPASEANDESRRLKSLLVIGPLAKGDAFVGGATVSFRLFVDFLNKTNVLHRVVDTRKHTGLFHSIRNFSQTILSAIRHIGAHDAVMLHGSRKGILYVAPIVYMLASLTGVRFSLRPFGGDFFDMCERVPFWHRAILHRTAFRADPLFVETKALMERCEGLGVRAVWFPTGRPAVRSGPVSSSSPFRKRFVFLSQMTMEKGVDIILDTISELDDTYTFHLYGPNCGDAYRTLNVRDGYQGAVAPEHVNDTLSEYDVLVLPTVAPEEGYPGVIFEAYALGLPVIATRWLSLPDIVKDGVSGILVAPRSVPSLLDAILSIDEDAYQGLREGAFEMSKRFDSDALNRHVLTQIF